MQLSEDSQLYRALTCSGGEEKEKEKKSSGRSNTIGERED
jgi:hypothetical protein